MKRLKLFLPLIAFMVLAVVLYRGLSKDPNAMPSALIDQKVPEFSLRLLNQSDVIADQTMIKGPALLNIWATWCAPCRIEHPYLNQLANEGVTIYGLNYKDNPADAHRWLEQRGNPYQLVLMDLDGRLGFDLGVFGAPETYLIDSQGVIRFKHVGVLNEQVFAQDFAPLLQQFSAANE